MTKKYVACEPGCPDATCHACGSGRQVHELKAEVEAERHAKHEARALAAKYLRALKSDDRVTYPSELPWMPKTGPKCNCYAGGLTGCSAPGCEGA